MLHKHARAEAFEIIVQRHANTALSSLLHFEKILIVLLLMSD